MKSAPQFSHTTTRGLYRSASGAFGIVMTGTPSGFQILLKGIGSKHGC